MFEHPAVGDVVGGEPAVIESVSEILLIFVRIVGPKGKFTHGRGLLNIEPDRVSAVIPL